MKTAVVQAQQKWECHYVTAYSEVVLIQNLNEAGEEGWEPFSASQYKDSRGSLAWIVLLKRPATGQPAKAPGEATEPGKQREAVPQPTGFDLDGDTFDVKVEPEVKPAPPAAKSDKPATTPAKPSR